MDVAVNMSVEEYDDYREYQKEKSSMERKVHSIETMLRAELNNICEGILNSVECDKAKNTYGKITNQDAMNIVIDLAVEHFC